MDYLKELLQSKSLDEIEAHLQAQFASVADSTFEVKLAIMLAMLGEMSIAALGRIDTASFPKRLAERLDSLNAERRDTLLQFIEHQRENRRVVEQIEAAGAELPALNSQIEQLLERYDALLRRFVTERDSLPAGKL